MNALHDAYNLGRLDAACRCAAIMIDEKRPDIAKDIIQTMKLDREKLVKLKTLLAAKK